MPDVVAKLSASAQEVRRQTERRLGQLRAERESFVSHWRDLSEHILPRRGRWLATDRNRGDKRNQKVINPTATLAARTLSSGMMAGLTSPARPWFRLQAPDPDLSEFGPVKLWLHTVEQRMRTVFAKSNLYNALPQLYEEQGVFGTGAMAWLFDFEDVCRGQTFTVGEYYIANSARGVANTFYRDCSYTVAQLVEEFGLENVSTHVRGLYDRGSYDSWVECVHAIEPNRDYEAGRLGWRGKRFRSVYYEKGADQRRLLRLSGFNRFPVLAPRWHLMSGDVYGRSPGMDALGDARAIQTQERRKAQAIDKMSNPPMVGPGALKGQPASVLPGALTYVDVSQGGQEFKPAYTVNPRVVELFEDIAKTEDRINRAFFADLFLALTLSDRREITAREVEERHEEKLLMLGPVVEREQDEMLDPLIDLTYDYMGEAGLIPPPPRELHGAELGVEYISMLAQAQKAVATAAIERTAAFVGNLAGANPEIVDKIDMDAAVDEYGDALGVNPRIIRSDDAVRKMRQDRAQQQQRMQAAQAGLAAAQGAKVLSETEVGGGRNALQQMIGAA